VRISRRPGPAAIVLALLATTCTGSGPAGPSPSPAASGSTVKATGPNVVILLSDDQAFRVFDRDLMPNVFSKLVDQGVDFTRAYVNVSQCCPSRSSILTGLYSHDTGVDSNTVPLDGRVPFRPVFPLALQAAGYRTGLFGKYLNSEPCDPQPGWGAWVCTQDTERNPTLNINGRIEHTNGYTADILANKAINFIANRQAAHEPFFLYYAPKDPHLPANDDRDKRPVPPYDPPSFNADPNPDSRPAWTRLPPLSPTNQKIVENWHTKMTRQIPPLDADMGRILEALGSQAADTLVIFMSDNGFMYGEHRLTSKNQPYEESVRVPLVIRFPTLLPAAKHFSSDALVSNVDLAPTIMDAVGIPWEADGTSLLPLLERKVTKVRDGLLLEWCQAGNTDPCQSEKRGEELNVFNLPHYWGLETDRYAYIEYATGESELYDLRSDPYELTNLAGEASFAKLKRTLSRQLAALRAPPDAPGTTIATGPSGSVPDDQVTFTFFSQSRTTTLRCSLKGPGQDGSAAQCKSGTITYRSLRNGAYTFTVQAVDARGHPDPTPATRSFTIAF
jgi:N-acetylglucosamine-6-sulfatase